MKHLHTKAANADKIDVLIRAVEELNSQMNKGEGHDINLGLARIRVESIAALAHEADLALAELKDQTGII